MKKSLVFLSIVLSFFNALGQTNTYPYPASGNIGIGTDNPLHKLSIKDGGQSINFLTGTNSSGYNLDIGLNDDGLNFSNNSKIRSFNFKSLNQTIKLLTGTNTSGYTLSIGTNDDGVNFSNDSEIRSYNFKNVGQTIKLLAGYNSSGYTLSIGVNDNGVNFSNNSTIRGYNFENSNGTLLKITHNGNVGIGTKTPDAKLSVKGKIHAEEVKIDLSVPGPDYVFKKNYDLLSIEEVQQHITTKGHLPNIPSAKEMETNGVELGVMNMKLLEKIEELTLYTIAQEKQLQQQQITNKKLDTKNQELETRLMKLERLLHKK